MGNYRLDSVITTNEGTIAHFENTNTPFCPTQGSECKELKDAHLPRHITFFDKNNNQKLDAGDERLELFCGFYDKKDRDYYYSANYTHSLPEGFGIAVYKGEVTEDDIKKFGDNASAIFEKASKDRKAITEQKRLKIDSGKCTIPYKYFYKNIELSNRDHNHFTDGTKTFNPPLTLRTVGARIDEQRLEEPTAVKDIYESLMYYTQYTLKINNKLYKGNIDPRDATVDPAQCLSAIQEIDLGKKIPSKITTTSGWTVEEARADLGKLYFGFGTSAGQGLGNDYDQTVPWANEFNIENDRRKVDAYYYWFNENRIKQDKPLVTVMHLDLIPQAKEASKADKKAKK